MAELGALSLRIEATGDKEVLAALNAIESKARVVDKTTTDAVAALKALGISAKAVGTQVAVASGDMQTATGVLQKLGNTSRVIAREQVEAAKVEANANRVRARGFQEYLGTLSQGARLEATRADSVRQLIALESALQKQLQATNLTFAQRVRLGETLSRVQNSIAGGIETGTVAAQRSIAVQRVQVQGLQVLGREVVQANGKLSGFGKSGLNAFNALAFGVSQMASSGTVSLRSMVTSAASVLSFFGPTGAITAAVLATGTAIVDVFRRSRAEIEETRKKATEELARLDASLESARRSRDPAGLQGQLQDNTRELAEQNIKAASILHLTEEARTEEQRKQLAVSQARIKVLQQEIQIAERALRNPPPPIRTGTLPGVSVKGTVTDSKKAIAEEISQLTSLSQTRGLAGVEVVRLAAIERQLAQELRNTKPDKEREAEIWEQIAKARQAAAKALPAATVRDLVSGRPQARGQIVVPPSVAQKLDPAQIQADVQQADRDMAARVAAYDFHDTEQALSESLANALGSAIATGFANGLGQGGIGEGFKQMAAELAQGLGSVAIDYGLKAQAIAKLMAGISKFLIANPVLAIGLGIGLVAAGRALGGSSGGRGVGGGGGGAGIGSRGPFSTERLILDPNATARQRVAGLSGDRSTAAVRDPFAGLEFMVANSPTGRAFLAKQIGQAHGRGIP